MATDNDFFDQFREMSDALVESPTPQTWQRVASRLKKGKVDKKSNPFLSASFLSILVLSTFLIITLCVVGFLHYREVVKNENRFLFFAEMQKRKGVWIAQSNFSKAELKISQTSPEKIDFCKSIVFKNDTLNRIYFSLLQNDKKNFLLVGDKTFSEKIIGKNSEIFIFQEEEIEIVNDTAHQKLIFIYGTNNKIVYTK